MTKDSGQLPQKNSPKMKWDSSMSKSEINSIGKIKSTESQLIWKTKVQAPQFSDNRNQRKSWRRILQNTLNNQFSTCNSQFTRNQFKLFSSRSDTSFNSSHNHSRSHRDATRNNNQQYTTVSHLSIKVNQGRPFQMLLFMTPLVSHLHASSQEKVNRNTRQVTNLL